MNGPLQSTRVEAYCRQDVPRRCVQGKTLYMFEQFGVDGKLYVEVMSWSLGLGCFEQNVQQGVI